MKIKVVIIVSRLMCLALLLRICFLSLTAPTIISLNHSVSIAKKNVSSNYFLNFDLKENVEQLVNNINSILHFFKNRIAENKKLVLSFLFCLINGIFLFSSSYFSAKIISFTWDIFPFIFSVKNISFSILRI